MATNRSKKSLDAALGSIPIKYLAPEMIIKAVCNYYGTTLEEIIRKRRKGNRKRELVNSRKVIAYLLIYFHKDKISLRELGSYLKYDHSLMLHHHKDCQNLMDVDKNWREEVHGIMMKIAAPKFEETNITIKEAIEDPIILKNKRYETNKN